MGVKGVRYEDVELIRLVQYKDWWRALVNGVMNLRIL
jgi:hypothetical protein